MNEFPILKTGAVMQYPVHREVRFSTTVVRFVDGSEQRFPQYQTPLHRWIVKLDRLDEGELSQVRSFFRDRGGASGTFEFTDPWDNTNYPLCSLDDDQIEDTVASESRCQTTLTIRENRS